MVRTALLASPLEPAEIVTAVFVATDAVLTVNVPEVFPAEIVSVVGIVADAEELVREITSPPDGAGEVMETVAVLDFPPFTDVGLKVNDFTAGGETVNDALTFVFPNETLIVATVDTDTATVGIVNVAAVLPAATVTEVGGIAAPALLVRRTFNPLAGAAPVKLMVPEEFNPPTTVVGSSLRAETDGGVIVSDAVSVNPAKLAVRVAVC